MEAVSFFTNALEKKREETCHKRKPATTRVHHTRSILVYWSIVKRSRDVQYRYCGTVVRSVAQTKYEVWARENFAIPTSPDIHTVATLASVGPQNQKHRHAAAILEQWHATLGLYKQKPLNVWHFIRTYTLPKSKMSTLARHLSLASHSYLTLWVLL